MAASSSAGGPSAAPHLSNQPIGREWPGDFANREAVSLFQA